MGVKLIRLGEIGSVAPRPFVIGGLLGYGEAMLMIGAPKSGKSAVAVAAARCVALGEPFFGRNTRRGLVLYVAAERGAETDIRLQLAFESADDPPIRLAKAKIYADPGAADELADMANALGEAIGLPVTLAIFDTVNAILREADADENSSRDINRLTAAIDRFREATGAAVIAIHHAKRGEKRSRGSDALEGWAETVAIVDGRADLRRLTVIRSNSVEEGVKASFSLQATALGQDETGAASSAVLAVPMEKQKGAAKPIRLPPDVETALSELQCLAARAHPVALADWRSAAMKAFGDRKQPVLRQAFSSARKRLETEQLVIVDGETVSVRTASASVS